MTNEHDQQLAALFKDASTDLPAEAFTQQVMFEVRKESRRELLLWVLGCIIVTAFMWVFAPYIQSTAQIISSAPGNLMASLTNNLQAISTLPLTYIFACPFLAYALYSRYRNQLN